ncbi:MAG TPA: endolytic transglycosylase MltG [Patescibacteria group bacterium]|nr:endolytic transglycosylase MltG [Patescibacteria group bacterium]
MFLPKKKKYKGKIILLVFIFFIAALFYYWYNLLPTDKNNQQIIEFKIEPGWGSAKISQELKKSGLIRSDLIFQFYALISGANARLQDGNYFLSQNLTTPQIIQILSRGEGATKEITLTFIEGWSNKDYADYLAKKGLSERSDFFNVIQEKADFWDQYDFLREKPKNLDLEGYLFPDTYRVYRNASLKEIIEKILNNFGKKLTSDLRSEISRQGKTIHEILTLASILEKEVSSDEDRKKVADIFYKRLDAGIALQADSTVNYATGKSTPRASAEDLKIDSPYNTYKYKGLPLGPINNPGMSAILAAIYPAPNPYWYFLTTPDGTVIYSKTFDEHVKAKGKYY